MRSRINRLRVSPPPVGGAALIVHLPTRFMRFLIIATLMAVLLPVATGSTAAQGFTSPDEAARQAVAAAKGVAPDLLIVRVIAEAGSWAYGTTAIPAPAGDHGVPVVTFFLAHDPGDGWIAELRYTAAFDALLTSAPANFPTPEIRAALEGFGLAGDGSADLSFPWAVGEAWRFNGPHPNGGSTVWGAVDFYPPSLAANAPILAMRGGIAHRPCANLLIIDHGDGWSSAYYHLASIAVAEGQSVARGQLIGRTSAAVGCGGFATGPHVHVWLVFQGNDVEIAGKDIGGWTVERGAAPYDGCFVRGSDRRCTSTFATVPNDGTIGSVAGVSISPTRTTVGVALTYNLTGFSPNATGQIAWRRLSGSTINIGTFQTNSAGAATGSFPVPATPGGPNQQITFSLGGESRTALFEVAPRIKINTQPGVRGQLVDVSLRGYAKQETVRIRWKRPDGTWVQLATVVTSNTGSANVWVTVPGWAPNGNNSVRGDGTVFRQQTNVANIQGGPFQPASVEAPDAVATATPLAIDRSALPVETPLPIVLVTDDHGSEPIVAVTDGDPETAWVVDSPIGAELTADLGEPARLSAIAWLTARGDCGAIERIETSPDGVSWTSLNLPPPGAPGVWQLIPTGNDARYVRWTVTAVDGAPTIGCLSEIAVWGEPAPVETHADEQDQRFETASPVAASDETGEP